MSNVLIAAIRTAVAAGVGAAVVWANQRWGLAIEEDVLVLPAVALATGIYNALVNALAARWPTFGWLLGVPMTPTYYVEKDRRDP